MKPFAKAAEWLGTLFRAALFVGKEEPSPARARRWRRIRIAFFSALTLSLLFTMWKLLYDGPRIGGIDNISLFFLLNLNIILLLVMALVVGRNLVKFYLERHARAANARFQTKLILAFLAITLIPCVLLFVVASGLITNSIDNWSSLTVERSLRDSLEVAQNFYRKSEQAVAAQAADVAGIVGQQGEADLQGVLAKSAARYKAKEIAVYGADFRRSARIVQGAKEEALSPKALDQPLVDRLRRGETVTESRSAGDGAYIFSLAPVMGLDGKLAGAVIFLEPVDRSLVEKIERISRTLDEYKQLKQRRLPIKMMYEITLLLVTLVVIFGALWFALYLARDITVPLHQLVEATQKVSEGDLTVRVEEKTRDEVGVLIRSFNRMTEDLALSRAKVDQSHKELVEINRELDHRRQYIETILANIAAGVISIDGRGHISTCNPSALAILHLKSAGMLGKYYEEVFEMEHLEAIRGLLREMGRSGKDYLKREIPVPVDGVQHTLLVHISSLKDAEGIFMGVVVVFEDITAIIAAEKTSAWREIAKHMAHEIKNPLTPIRLNAERLRRNYEQDQDAFERNFDSATRVIIQEVEVIRTLVDEFSRFAQLPQAAPEMTPLHDIIGDVAAMYRDTKPGIAIRTDFDPAIGLVRLDKEQMHRAFRNLVENAVDAVPEGGTIEIRTRLGADGQRVLIEIMDDGPGIDAKDLDKVFLPYFSTKKKGTGLGLAIVSRIVADHEGSITVKNLAPRGTLMTIDLPIA
ncbi:MAG: HAMP domain-containing protein [Nitrospinae bacterium]|nr:HAMP domain-containing protein [Nitrospinota bacterium]